MARKPADQSVSREEIILAAAEVLRRNGYEATTMKDIAAEVNLTAASLYHHFRNKDALLLAVLEGGLEHVITQLVPIVESDKSNADKLREMIAVHIRGLTENTAVGSVFVLELRTLMNTRPSARNAGEEDAAAYTEYIARRDAFFSRRDYFEKLFRRVVQEGITSGEFREVDAAIFTLAFLGAHNWVGVWYRPDGRLTGQQIADVMADTFLRSLLIRR